MIKNLARDFLRWNEPPQMKRLARCHIGLRRRVFGYAAQSHVMDLDMGFVLDMAEWFCISFEIGPVPCWPSVTQARLVSWMLSWASFSAWLGGSTSCWRSDEAGNEAASVSVNSHFHASVGTMHLIAMDRWILSWASLPAWLSGSTSCLR